MTRQRLIFLVRWFIGNNQPEGRKLHCFEVDSTDMATAQVAEKSLCGRRKPEGWVTPDVPIKKDCCKTCLHLARRKR